MGPQPIPLKYLHPAWVPWGDEWGAGVSFDCPTHGPPCRPNIFFSNGMSGHDLKVRDARRPLYFRWGSAFHELTVLELVKLGTCFLGWLADGELVPAR